ncbi:major facilitator superfamily domain-containing protein [Pterulicium gracile]|uniref:Major facilitator superfamily domain-containing protein n=1 Tax=Pterulicium gracile TaxID=1884261 RepID=A0A5C3QPT3_9AGAR|nr:major facilitator superfamily domain-containing protein [Pterula gracilis]
MDPAQVEVSDEQTPLLVTGGPSKKLPKFPVFQFSVLVLVQLCEPLSSQVIYPFIPQLVSELPVTGGDHTKVGYYAGLIESLFFATEAVTILFWSRTSDVIGRKPTLLIGSAGLCASMLFFGLSRTFWTLVISRCLCGALNGNIGVSKTVVGELLRTPAHRAQGFAFMPVTWAMGASLGPLMGGHLARPHDRWPTVFAAQFWIDYPYFLPCAIPAAITAACIGFNLAFLQETNKAAVGKWKKLVPWLKNQEPPSSTTIPKKPEQPQIPLRDILTPRVVRAVTNYGCLASIDIMLAALRPLFLAQPIEYGGLGMEPATIGTIMGTYGLICGLLQVFLFSPAVQRFGARNVFVTCAAAYIPVFAFYPLQNMAARKAGEITPLIWALIAVQHLFACIADGSFGCVSLFVNASAPTPTSLGATHGLAQTTASITRAIGPAIASSLFSLSVEHNILGGYAIFGLLAIWSLVLVRLGMLYPRELWTGDEEDED